ncbi:MAG: ABC transporter ATP-binding protein [Gammaproteobacteria bacterium]|nr:ABC transporter ATP-binding protein [Gammaproteobacteria bacterium]
MVEIYRKIRDLLDARERRNAVILFVLMLIMGLLEVVGVASILPFIAVLADPNVVYTNIYLNTAYQYLGFSNTDDFLLFLGSTLFVLVVGGLALKALTQWATTRYVQMRNYSLSSRLLQGYLNRPYSFFLNRHSADLGKSVLSEVGAVISKALMPAMELVANTIVAVLIISLVVAVNPMVAFVAFVVLGGAYAAIYFSLRNYINRIGTDRVIANQQRFQIAQEALGGIKDVKVLGLENGYVNSFQRPAIRMARISARQKFISEMPQFLMQAVVYGGMLTLLLSLLVAGDGGLSAVLPLMALYAFAGSRLNPALQTLYRSFTALRYGKPALDILHKDLVATDSIGGAMASTTINEKSCGILRLQTELQLDKITYTYPQADHPALIDLSITVPAKTTVGLVGSTGAGKTTAIDLILGLLVPQQGELRVDGVPVVGDAVRAWQRNLGYVPQHIFLTDDTVAANIAFGLSEKEVDWDAVERAACTAELHDFVMQGLPKGYQTMVGERGVRLSGGQRQRIGIARALYHDPDVLVLDEATSALDNLTEKAVMDAVHNLGHRKTIFLIAHRLSTVKDCDVIFLLKCGKLKASGTFAELVDQDESFRLMAAGMNS